MRKFILLFVFVLCLSGCQTANGQNPSLDTENAGEGTDEKEGTLMQKVMLNQIEFYGTVDPYGTEFSRHKIEEMEGYGSVVPEFGVVDFDGDGKNEVYIYYLDALILHEQDGVIYGFCEPYRGMLRVCTNGTFEGSHGADNLSRTVKVSFEKCEMKQDYIEFEEDSYTHIIKYTKGTSVKNEQGWYGENEVELTELEFNELLSQYPQGEGNPKYELNEKNVLEFVK